MKNKDLIIEKQKELIEHLENRIDDNFDDLFWTKKEQFESELAALEAEELTDEYHVWVIPERKEIYVEDRGGGFPTGATEHIVFDSLDNAVQFGKLLAKFFRYELELDNDAGKFAEESNNI